jgi:hypothetical protein
MRAKTEIEIEEMETISKVWASKESPPLRRAASP